MSADRPPPGPTLTIDAASDPGAWADAIANTPGLVAIDDDADQQETEVND